MELKLAEETELLLLFFLLIVPYGIETAEKVVGPFVTDLLIVPYGIETEVQ